MTQHAKEVPDEIQRILNIFFGFHNLIENELSTLHAIKDAVGSQRSPESDNWAMALFMSIDRLEKVNSRVYDTIYKIINRTYPELFRSVFDDEEGNA